MNDVTGAHGAYSVVSRPDEIKERQKRQLQYLFLPIEIFTYVAKREKAGILEVYKKEIEREIQKKTMLDTITINETLDSLVLHNFLTVAGIEVKENRAYSVHSDAEWMKDLIDTPEGIEKLVRMYGELASKK